MDIFSLSKSKTRESILNYFFADVERKHYLRELERILDISVGNIRRELLSLEKTGLFTKEKMGNQVYYSLNQKSPIFSEIKAIVSKTIGLEFLLRDQLIKIENIDFAFVYGSIARGEEDSLSDIDIFIIGDVNEDLLNKSFNKLEEKLSREINYTIFSKTNFKKEIKDSVFLKDIVSGKKIFLINTADELKKIIR